MDKSSKALAIVKKRHDERLAEAGLAKRQREVLEMLCEGSSVAETARWANVTRATIYFWIKTNAVFAAEYNRWQEEVKESCRSRLLAMTGLAASTLQKAIEAGDSKLAMQLLKALGLMQPTVERITDPEELKKRMELDARKRKLDLEREEQKMQVDHDVATMMDNDVAKLVADENRRNGQPRPPGELTKVVYQWKRVEPLIGDVPEAVGSGAAG